MFLAIISFSCSTWSKMEWNNLQDKKFILGSVYVGIDNDEYCPKYGYLTYDNQVLIEKAIKQIPIKDIVNALQKKYGISVDSTKFEKAKKKNREMLIQVAGYTWELKNLPKNYISIEIRLKTNFWSASLLSNKIAKAIFFPDYAASIDYAYSIILYPGRKKKGVEKYNYPQILTESRSPSSDDLIIGCDRKKREENIKSIEKYLLNDIFKSEISKWVKNFKPITDKEKVKKEKPKKEKVKKEKKKKEKKSKNKKKDKKSKK